MTLVWVSNAVPRPPAYVRCPNCTHFQLTFPRKRAAAIGIVNGIGNIGNMYVSTPQTVVKSVTYPTGFKAWVLIPGNQPGALSIISQWPYLWQHSLLVLYYPSVRI